MNQKSYPFFSMVALSLTLMTLIVVTQFFTNKSTFALKEGSDKAIKTFRINDGIQELVNLSFDLQTKFKNFNNRLDDDRIKSLKDSLIMLGYNASILTTATTDESKTLSSKINSLVDSQVSISETILNAIQNNDIQKRTDAQISLIFQKLGDKIYAECLVLQKMLRNNLQETLNKNNEQASQLSNYNRGLALIAILAILLLATIIIRRQSQQYRLIEELKLAETAALKSKNAKDEFLANMSHELRTPLNALIGFGNLLNTTPLNHDQKEYVDMIRSGGKNLLNIVNDVLDLSKIEAGKLSIAQKNFNLYHLFERIEKLFSSSVREKGLQYKYVIDSEVPEFVVGDPDRLQQIFVNLIGNAIKFTNKGIITVGASTIWEDNEKENYKLAFTVKDSGTGIPRNKIETIFERFEQLEQGSLKQHGGTGLGLTIVKNLVEKMDGSISVFSQPDEGSEFTFTCVVGKAVDITNLPEEGIAPSVVFAKNKTLVVEDNKANQVLLKHLLNRFQVDATLVENGKEAIELLEMEKFDLILMDIQMPKVDGYTAINIVRNKMGLNTPAIAMTAYVSETETRKCREADFDDYISKPLDENELVNKIAQFLHLKNETPQINNGKSLEYLKELVGDDESIIKEILNEMLLQWEKDKTELLIAGENKDVQKFRMIMHRMKSTFSPLGPDHIINKIFFKESHNIADSSVQSDYCYKFVSKIDENINHTFKSYNWILLDYIP